MSRTAFFKYHVYEKTNPSSCILESETGMVMVPDLKIVFGKIYLYALIECLIFTASLSVYPAVTILTQSEHHGNGHPWNGKSNIFFVFKKFNFNVFSISIYRCIFYTSCKLFGI